MTFQFKLPDIGEGIQEGEIVRWIKKEGEHVNEDEPFVEVMTDKATVELTSPRKGKIARHYVKEGDMAKVGQVIVDIDDGATGASPPVAPQAAASGGGGPSAPRAPAPAVPPLAQKPTAKAAESPEEKTLFDLPKEIAAATKVIERRGPATPPTPATRAPPTASAAPSGQRATAAPAVRRMARERGIDINQVAGTGQNGRVTAEDLQRFTAAPAASAAAPGGPGQPRFSYADVRYSTDASREERVPLRGLRRTIARSMERSKFTATHFTYVAEVDCDKLVELRDAAQAVAEERGVKIHFLPFIVKAAVAALKRHPDVNVAFDETTQEIVRKKYWHIGVATATENGLIVPVVKDADQKGILDIAREIADLSERTRGGKAKLEELSGSTFTITSLGKMGGLLATPILNYPEVAIMGVHEMRQVPVVRNGQLAVGWRMNLSFSFDHRIVDGYNGAMFANTLIRYLEEPQLLWLESL